MWMFCLYVCLSTTGMLGAHGGQMKASNTCLELKLGMVVYYYVAAGNQTQGLYQSNQCS